MSDLKSTKILHPEAFDQEPKLVQKLNETPNVRDDEAKGKNCLHSLGIINRGKLRICISCGDIINR